MSLSETQEEFVAWHRRVYPTAALAEVMVKRAEEVGEVARCIDRLRNCHPTPDELRAGRVFDPDAELHWLAELRNEFGDVVNVLFVMAGRYAGWDLQLLAAERAREVMTRTKRSGT